MQAVLDAKLEGRQCSMPYLRAGSVQRQTRGQVYEARLTARMMCQTAQAGSLAAVKQAAVIITSRVPLLRGCPSSRGACMLLLARYVSSKLHRRHPYNMHGRAACSSRVLGVPCLVPSLMHSLHCACAGPDWAAQGSHSQEGAGSRARLWPRCHCVA